MKPNYDVVKRWVNEAQEAVSSDNTMVQVNAAFYQHACVWLCNKTLWLIASQPSDCHTQSDDDAVHHVGLLIGLRENW